MSQEFQLTKIEQKIMDIKNRTVLVIIQSNQESRVGLWSKQMCIKKGLYHGSMLPQLDWAKE